MAKLATLCLLAVLTGCGATRQETRPASPAPAPSELNREAVRVLEEAGFVPGRIRCNSRVRWGKDLWKYSKQVADEIGKSWGVEPSDKQRHRAARVVLGYLVRSMFETIRPNNMSVMHLEGFSYQKDGQTKPLLIFRSAVMTDADQPGSCLHSLFEHAEIRHVINLYAGTFPLHDFIAAEQKVAAGAGVSHHSEAGRNRPWRKLIEDAGDYQENKQIAQQRVAELINTQVFRPNGKPPEGNILIHCGGGMHRTGMVFGILRRCINKDSKETIEAEYRTHTDFISDSEPCGFEPLNLQFIQDFDCGLLEQ
jgi:hypothetical protein